MNKKYVVGGLLLIFTLIGCFWLVNAQQNPQRFVIMAGERFVIRIADDQQEREQGLSGTVGLGKRQGMLFIFDEPGTHCFWMKDMKYSIDILWVHEGGKIAHIEEQVPPDSYPNTFCSPYNTARVLEVPAGTVRELGLLPGDSISF